MGMLMVGFTAPDIGAPFEWCGRVGKGHPDPDIGFAEGRFYLFTQQMTDFVSDGPWVGQVELRVGVDTDGDGAIDQWSAWETVKESYERTPGFSKQIARTPASIDLSQLPPGHGAAFELRLTDETSNLSKPLIESMELTFF